MRTLAKGGISLLVLFLVACGGGKGATDHANIRFVHLSPGTDNIGITVDDNTAVSSLKYHAATSYDEVDAGSRELKLKSVTTGATYVDATLTFAKDVRYSGLVYGGGSSVSIALLNDDTSDVSANKFKLRVINLATGLGSLDLYLLPSGTDLSGSTPALSAIAYGATIDFAEYTNGDYNIVLAPTGSKEVVYDSGRRTLAEKSKQTLVIYATGSGKLANAALLLTDDGGTTSFIDNLLARLKFVHAAIDLQAVDVLIDGSVILSNVPYGASSSYNVLNAGSRTVRIEPSSNPGTYVYDQTQSFSAAYDYSLVADNASGAGSAAVFPLQDDNLPPASGKAKLRIVNAGSDGTSYDFYLGYSKSVSNVAQGTGSAYQQVDPGTYALSFSPAGTTTNVVTLSAKELDTGHVYSVYVYGRTGAVGAVLIQDY